MRARIARAWRSPAARCCWRRAHRSRPAIRRSPVRAGRGLPLRAAGAGRQHGRAVRHRDLLRRRHARRGAGLRRARGAARHHHRVARAQGGAARRGRRDLVDLRRQLPGGVLRAAREEDLRRVPGPVPLPAGAERPDQAGAVAGQLAEARRPGLRAQRPRRGVLRPRGVRRRHLRRRDRAQPAALRGPQRHRHDHGHAVSVHPGPVRPDVLGSRGRAARARGGLVVGVSRRPDRAHLPELRRHLRLPPAGLGAARGGRPRLARQPRAHGARREPPVAGGRRAGRARPTSISPTAASPTTSACAGRSTRSPPRTIRGACCG